MAESREVVAAKTRGTSPIKSQNIFSTVMPLASYLLVSFSLFSDPLYYFHFYKIFSQNILLKIYFSQILFEFNNFGFIIPYFSSLSIIILYHCTIKYWLIIPYLFNQIYSFQVSHLIALIKICQIIIPCQNQGIFSIKTLKRNSEDSICQIK